MEVNFLSKYIFPKCVFPKSICLDLFSIVQHQTFCFNDDGDDYYDNDDHDNDDDDDDDDDDNDDDDDDDDDYINDDKQNHDEVLKAKRCPCKTRLYSAKSFYELFRHI